MTAKPAAEDASQQQHTRRPAPVQRKEAVPTPTWGRLVVQALRLSQRLDVGQLPEVEGETADARARRFAQHFESRLLHHAVVDAKGAPLYAADEWDVWLGSHYEELQPVLKKAFELSGLGAAQEAEAKNG